MKKFWAGVAAAAIIFIVAVIWILGSWLQSVINF